MKRLVLTATSLLLGTALGVGVAAAADPMPPMMPTAPVVVVPPAPTFGGFYVGVHGGVFHGDAAYQTGGILDDSEDGPERSFVSDLGGLVAGGQVGFNLQRGSFVVGAVADASWSNVQGTITVEGPPGIFQTDINYLASLRGRVGFVIGGQTLLYVHGGVAVAGVSWASGNQVVAGGDYPGPWTDGEGAAMYLGYTIGGGFEHMLNERVSIFGEFAMVRLGNRDFTFFEEDDNEDRAINIGISGYQIRGGMNIHF